MAQSNDQNEKIIEEIERLEGNAATVNQQLAKMKEKALKGEKIDLDHLDITVKSISRLDAAMRDRRDVGH